MNRTPWRSAVCTLALASSALAYPGGTPDFQTDAAPFCAGCHASRDASALAGAGKVAQEQVAEQKHISKILTGEGGYATLSEPDRRTLVEQIRALDAASTVQMRAPAQVKPGEIFQVQVRVTGGAGPVVAVGLVDRDHRWFARPAPSAGWQIAAPPEITGSDGQPRLQWLTKRPAEAGRNLAFVNVPGIESDAAAKRWDSAEVVFTLRAPSQPGKYPLAAAYWYGTEKSTLLGYKTTPQGMKEVRGGFTGGSGRVAFTALQQITVQ